MTITLITKNGKSWQINMKHNDHKSVQKNTSNSRRSNVRSVELERSPLDDNVKPNWRTLMLNRAFSYRNGKYRKN